MTAEAKAHLDAAIYAGERDLAARRLLLDHPELPEAYKRDLYAMARMYGAENERQWAAFMKLEDEAYARMTEDGEA